MELYICQVLHDSQRTRSLKTQSREREENLHRHVLTPKFDFDSFTESTLTRAQYFEQRIRSISKQKTKMEKYPPPSYQLQ